MGRRIKQEGFNFDGESKVSSTSDSLQASGIGQVVVANGEIVTVHSLKQAIKDYWLRVDFPCHGKLVVVEEIKPGRYEFARWADSNNHGITGSIREDSRKDGFVKIGLAPKEASYIYQLVTEHGLGAYAPSTDTQIDLELDHTLEVEGVYDRSKGGYV